MTAHPLPGWLPSRWRAALAAPALTLAAALLSAAPASAHPHMFFDAQAVLTVDDQGRLTGLRVGFLVDELNTEYTIEEMQVDADGDGALTPEDQKILADGLKNGLREWAFFTDLRIGGERVDLGDPSAIETQLAGPQLAARLDFTLAEPLPLKGVETNLKLYDPTYYTEVRTAAAPVVDGPGAAACAVEFTPFTATENMKIAQAMLSKLSREDTSGPKVGGMFADKAEIACGGES